jgi:hypothetical protein
MVVLDVSGLISTYVYIYAPTGVEHIVLGDVSFSFHLSDHSGGGFSLMAG